MRERIKQLENEVRELRQTNKPFAEGNKVRLKFHAMTPNFMRSHIFRKARNNELPCQQFFLT